MLNNVDFPTLGKPTKPTSASNLSSRVRIFFSPGSPFSATLGVLLVGDLKQALPLPPLPPLATTNSLPSSFKSHKNVCSGST